MEARRSQARLSSGVEDWGSDGSVNRGPRVPGDPEWGDTSAVHTIINWHHTSFTIMLKTSKLLAAGACFAQNHTGELTGLPAS